MSAAPALRGERQPLMSYLLLLLLGIAPLLLVSEHYGVLPNRMVIRWDMFGRMTVIGTRAQTVMVVAQAAAGIAILSLVLAVAQARAMRAMGVLTPFLGLNIAQALSINLTCGMLVSDALGLQLAIKPMIPPAMAVVLFAAGVLFWRLEIMGPAGRWLGGLLALAAVGVLVFSAIAANMVVGFYASALAALAMAALALPPRRA